MRPPGGANNPSKAPLTLKCTAEHLVPVSDGGRTDEPNVVAACYFCNSTRHKAKRVLPPDQFGVYVRKRLEQKRWHQLCRC